MAEHPMLSGPSVKPAQGGAPKKIVVFLHGVGADGNDLIGLAPMFQRILPDAAFFSPNAPFPYDMAPFGYQWFSLKDMGPETRLKGSRAAAPILNAYLDHLLALFGLADDKMALIGFSQGTMMSLHVGLRRAKALGAIVGYSGMLSGPELLADEIRSRPPVLLVHGEADQVLPIASLPAAESALKKVGVPVEAHARPGLAHGIDEEGIRLGLDFLERTLGAAA